MEESSAIGEEVWEAHSNNEKYTYKPTQWWSLYKRDIARYKGYRGEKPFLVIYLTEPGLQALLQYRIAASIYLSRLPRLLKAPLMVLAVIWLKIIEMTVGISIPYRTTIGPGFYIGHFGNIFLNEDVVIGHTCNISQGVTIGLSGRGENYGSPTIGNRVYIATNAVVVGKITVGDDAVIAANSLVTADVAPHTTVIGVPAQFKNNHGSKVYIEPHH